MDDFDIPIFKKTYDLYKTFYGYRALIPKQDRHTIWQKSEDLILGILEEILMASKLYGTAKTPVLENASVKLNLLRVFIRLMKEVRTIDNKRYAVLEESVDEIGRMLGGWIRSTRDR